jgi:peptide/nickel transport system permease protein
MAGSIRGCAVDSSLFKRLLKEGWFLSGVVLTLALALLVVAGVWISPYDPFDNSFAPLLPPSSAHWLGVNDGGMDIFSELALGLGNTLLFSLFAGAVGLALGIAVGLVSAWKGGWVDDALMRLADVLMAVPPVMIMIVAAAFFRPSPEILALTLAFISWPTTARAIRSQALVVKRSLHVRAAREMGGTGRYIIATHLLPELFPLYIIGLVAKIRMAVFMEASLAFLGLFDPGRKSLGMMIRCALQYYYLDIWWNWLLPPVVCFTLIVMSVTFLAVGLEKIFDPRLKEV